jgi:hypothetical protein
MLQDNLFDVTRQLVVIVAPNLLRCCSQSCQISSMSLASIVISAYTTSIPTNKSRQLQPTEFHCLVRQVLGSKSIGPTLVRTLVHVDETMLGRPVP